MSLLLTASTASDTLRRRRLAGRARPAAVVALLGITLFGGGVFAYRFLVDRPGEAAIERLIPADAQMVATMDLKPSSAEQAALFGRVAAALEREGLTDRLTKAFDDNIAKDPISRDLLPLADRSYAVAVWHIEDATPEGALIVAVKDAAKAAETLAKHAARTEQHEGLTVYTFENGGSSHSTISTAMIGGYAVAAERPVTLLRIRDVAEKRSPALSSVSGYQQARAALPRDANLMAFMSPEALRAAARQGTSVLGAAGAATPDPTRGAGWLALSATVREGGIALDWRGTDTRPALKRMGSIAAVDTATLQRLPSGAIGVVAVSQPAIYAQSARDVAGEVGDDTRESVDRGLREFEHETHIAPEADVLPAFQGATLVAAYPTDGNTGVDVLAVVDDAHGADPAALAEKLRGYLERERAPVDFHRESAGGTAQVWSIVSRDAHHSTYDADRATGVQKAMNDGRLVYAQVGKAVLIASSRPLLDRAVASYQSGGAGGDGLLTAGGGTDSGGFSALQGRLVPGAQMALMVSAPRLCNLLRPTLTQNGQADSSGIGTNDMLSLFDSTNSGLVVSGRYDGQVATGSVFIPFDFERAVGLAGKAARAAEAREKGETVEAPPAPVQTEEDLNSQERG